ncbi:MAG: HlyC/CorC family transporter [Dysgonomonadaceae bacterium]|nr:HlyC/CorC family transporter [Dysgonamonadaceae bacterium]HQG07778.1 hemolysin family protein [Dysgonamonadaceae bacterium]
MIEVLIILLLIVLNGFFALSEIAVVSSSKTKLESERKKGNSGAETALKLKADPDNFLSAVQVGITLIGIVNGAYGGSTLSVYVEPFFRQFAWSAPYASTISIILVVFLITYVSIVIGELVPKTIALNNPEKVSIFVSRPVHVVSIVFYPFVRLLAASTSLFNKLIGLKPVSDTLSEMELRAMLKTASKEGVIEREENIIHEQVFYFSDKRARHLMTHRTDVEWVNVLQKKEQIVADLLKCRHSKVLACNGKLDDFVGIISIKEFLIAYYANHDFSLNELVQEPLIFPSSLRAQKVLETFRDKHKSFAVVVDEYGSLDGIITLHDIFENLVGTLVDENENEEPDIFMRNDHSALVNGEAPLEILTLFLDDFIIDFETIDYSTIAGFVLSNINKIPQVGDKFVYDNTEFEIVDVDGNKIDKVLITKKQKDSK